MNQTGRIFVNSILSSPHQYISLAVDVENKLSIFKGLFICIRMHMNLKHIIYAISG